MIRDISKISDHFKELFIKTLYLNSINNLNSLSKFDNFNHNIYMQSLNRHSHFILRKIIPSFCFKFNIFLQVCLHCYIFLLNLFIYKYNLKVYSFTFEKFIILEEEIGFME